MSKHDRQSFLGEASEQIIKATTVGLVGLGGGGSHVVQQLAHIGVERYVLVDPDVIEESNLNRLVGGTSDDVAAKAAKVAIAERVVRGAVLDPKIDSHKCNWQQAVAALKVCDVIISGVDLVIAKDELGKFCRRYLIPLIDMGMDVHRVGGRYLVAGQVTMTTPGAPCLRCMGIVTNDLLAQEANRYGDAGGQPQVVWPNGVLASTAVALFMQLICPWHDKGGSSAYLEYDGNRHTLTPSKSFALIHQQPCPHHFPEEAGDPLFDIRAPATQPTANADVIKVEAAFAPSLETGVSLRLRMSQMWRRLRNG